MRFSVIIPLYNKEAYIEETLNSIADQQKAVDEIIIVDDASTDNSLAIVKAYLPIMAEKLTNTKVQVIELTENRGPGFARNKGLMAASGEIISFLDADDLYDKELIQQADYLFEQKQCDFLVLGIELFPAQLRLPDLSKLWSSIKPVSVQSYRIEAVMRAITSPHFIMGVGSNVMVRRAFVENIRYNEKAQLNEGIDFWYQVLKEVLKSRQDHVFLLDGGYLKVRQTPGSLSRKTYPRWHDVPFPPTLQRLEKSKDNYDQQLIGVISGRWIKHGIRNIESRRQRLVFIIRYRQLILNYLKYVFTRKHKSYA